MQSGLSFTQLLWEVGHTPLLTYWSKIGSAVADPIWQQAAFWREAGWLSSGLVVLVIGLAGLLVYAGWRIRGGRSVQSALAWATLLATGLAIGLPLGASSDPRWHERSADPAYNQVVLNLLNEQATTPTLVILDLLPEMDMDGRSWLWLDRTVVNLHTIGWLRKTPLTGAHQAELARWLAPYPHLWLSLEETDERSPDSTTERWLDSWAFRGRSDWVGNQRLVEYLTPLPDVASTTVVGPFRFGNSELTPPVVLEEYRRQSPPPFGQSTGERVTLVWQGRAGPEIRFSLQALDASGKLLGQVDRAPGSFSAGPPYIDQVGLQVPTPSAQLILKIYDANTGVVWQAQQADGTAMDYLVLANQAD